MNGTREIRTERLRLRRYVPEDAVILHEKFGCDPAMYQYSGWNPYATEETALETVQNFIRDYEKNDFYGWAIEYQDQMIGTIGAYDHDPEQDSIEIGISIARDAWGKGFASEAIRAVLQYLTEQEGIRTVTAWCASDNIGSAKALRKAGMIQTSEKKNGLEVSGQTYDQLLFRYEKEK